MVSISGKCQSGWVGGRWRRFKSGTAFIGLQERDIPLVQRWLANPLVEPKPKNGAVPKGNKDYFQYEKSDPGQPIHPNSKYMLPRSNGTLCDRATGWARRYMDHQRHERGLPATSRNGLGEVIRSLGKQ